MSVVLAVRESQKGDGVPRCSEMTAVPTRMAHEVGRRGPAPGPGRMVDSASKATRAGSQSPFSSPVGHPTVNRRNPCARSPSVRRDASGLPIGSSREMGETGYRAKIAGGVIGPARTSARPALSSKVRPGGDFSTDFGRFRPLIETKSGHFRPFMRVSGGDFERLCHAELGRRMVAKSGHRLRGGRVEE